MIMMGTMVTMMIAMTLTTVSTIRTTIFAITTLWALTTLATLTGRTLYITLGLLDKHAVRELVLTSLRIDLKELHLDLVTLLDTSLLDSLKALPVNLGDMEQTILTRHDLNKATIRHN